MALLEEIQESVRLCGKSGDFVFAAKAMLDVLGYRSGRVFSLPQSPSGFLQFNGSEIPDTQAARKFIRAVKSVNLLFQFTETEIDKARGKLGLQGEQNLPRDAYKGFFFFAVELEGGIYRPREYRQFTREINRKLSVPAIVLYRCGTLGERYISISFVGRRADKRIPYRDVLRGPVLLPNINCEEPSYDDALILGDLAIKNVVLRMENSIKEKGKIAAALWAINEALHYRNYMSIGGFYARLQKLFDYAKERGYVPSPVIYDHIPNNIWNAKEMSGIIKNVLEKWGIPVCEHGEYQEFYSSPIKLEKSESLAFYLDGKDFAEEVFSDFLGDLMEIYRSQF